VRETQRRYEEEHLKEVGKEVEKEKKELLHKKALYAAHLAGAYDPAKPRLSNTEKLLYKYMNKGTGTGK